MSKQLTKKTSGFTIIEVIIVLAIAGVIMLVVFLAVPALQRTTRNTTRKREIGRIASSVTNFVANNNGTAPSTAAHVQTILSDAGNMSIYQFNPATASAAGAMTQGKVSVTSGAIATAPTIAISGTSPTDAIEIDTAAACISGAAGTTQAAPNTKAIALLYTLEPGTGANYTIACQDI